MSEALSLSGEWRLEGSHVSEGVHYLPFMPPSIIQQTSDFPAHPGDVIFGTYPASGTPQLAELMFMIYHKADVEAAKKKPHGARIRFLEHLLPNMDIVGEMKAKPPPRLIKTHLPASFFKKQLSTSGVRAVVMIRHPKDALVSFFKFYKSDPGYVKYPGNWNDFFQLFREKKLFGGDWFVHTKSWLAAKGSNLKVLFYEDVIEHPEKNLREVAEFCNQTLTDEEFARAAEYLKQVPEQCVSGKWEDFFTPEQDELFDELCKNEMDNALLPYFNAI